MLLISKSLVFFPASVVCFNCQCSLFIWGRLPARFGPQLQSIPEEIRNAVYWMVVSIGIEPMTSPLSGVRSGLLSYETIWWLWLDLNQRPSDYESGAQPLSYITLVWVDGFEPPRLSEGIYSPPHSASLPHSHCLVDCEGLEPSTLWLKVRYSNQLS